jgi:putative oxidoreductase
MKDLPGRFSSLSYALMRFIVAALYACHGAQKVFGAFGGHVMKDHPLPYAGGIIEIIVGPLIALGFFTRVAAFIASGEMAVAYFTQHAPHGFWPIVNKGELAVAYCFVFLFVASFGAGRYSFDQRRRRRLIP